MTADEVKALIESGIPGARAEVCDLTGTGDHFAVTVVAEAFRGRSLLEQHRMVQAAVASRMEEEGRPGIHALQMKTIVPEEVKA